MTADVCSFSRLLVYNYATARNGVCDARCIACACLNCEATLVFEVASKHFEYIIYAP